MSKTTKTPLRNLQHHLWLHDDALEKPKRWSNFLDGIDMQIYMQLPWCFLGTSNMSNTTNTPLRNLQHPWRLQGRHLEDTLENQRVGPLSRNAEIWKLICRNFQCPWWCSTEPSQNNSELWIVTQIQHTGVGRLSTRVETQKLMYSWGIHHVKKLQDSSQEPPVSS